MKHAALWKRILHEGIQCSSPEYGKAEFLDPMAAEIIRAPIIVDSRIRDEDAEEGRPWRWDEYKNVSIPFDLFWSECEVRGTRIGQCVCGALVEFGRMTDDLRGRAPADAAYVMQLHFAAALHDAPPNYQGNMLAFFNTGRELITEHLKTMMVYGRVPQGIFKHVGTEGAANHLASQLDNVLDLLFLLGCKNVDIQPRDPDPKQAKIARKRHGDTPHGYRYHVLVVRPAGSRSDAPAQEIGTMPRHVCRGHFAEYGPKYGKGLLFGKYEGRFYVPPHVKGNKDRGTVEKDYEVRP